MNNIGQFTDKIIQGDCLDILRTIPDNSVQMTFADPPFNLKKKYKSYKDMMHIQEYLDWCEQWIMEMVRITKPSGSIFIHNIPKWCTFYTSYLNRHADFKHWISWDAPTAPMGKSLQPSHYGILFYAKDNSQLLFNEIRHPHKRERKSSYLLKDYGGKKEALHPFGPLVSDVWTDIHRIKHNKYRDEHPCQLPLHLLERIILMATNENDTVLDPFNGTGTTALAAKRLGRHYIGLELDPTYVEITNQKLAYEKADSKIGNSWVSFYLDEIVTLCSKDWEQIKQYYVIPDNPKDIDHTPVQLRTKHKITTPIARTNGTSHNNVEILELFDFKTSIHKNYPTNNGIVDSKGTMMKQSLNDIDNQLSKLRSE